MASNNDFPEFPDLDVSTIPRLRCQRNRRSAGRDQDATLVDAAQILSDSGRAGHVISRDPAGGEWSVTLGPAAPESA